MFTQFYFTVFVMYNSDMSAEFGLSKEYMEWLLGSVSIDHDGTSPIHGESLQQSLTDVMEHTTQ